MNNLEFVKIEGGYSMEITGAGKIGKIYLTNEQVETIKGLKE